MKIIIVRYKSRYCCRFFASLRYTQNDNDFKDNINTVILSEVKNLLTFIEQ